MPTGNVQIKRATAADLGLIVPLFDAYRQFYRKPGDLEEGRRFLKERLFLPLHMDSSTVYEAGLPIPHRARSVRKQSVIVASVIAAAALAGCHPVAGHDASPGQPFHDPEAASRLDDEARQALAAMRPPPRM